ncbi:MAG: hypothetical protein RLZ33_2893, partial [Bacteroidota bacterium]
QYNNKPILQEIYLPNKPVIPLKTKGYATNKIVFIWTAFTIIVVHFSMGFEQLLDGFWIALLPVYLFSTIGIVQFVRNSEKNDFEELLNRYEQENSFYTNQLNKKAKSEQRYHIEKLKNEYYSNFENLKIYLSKIFEDNVSVNVDFKRLNKSLGKVSKGVSENDFFELLKRELNEYQMDNMSEINFGSFSLFPDILIKSIKYGIYIAIEIDEPYVGFNGKPIHFLEGSDDFRDKNFLDFGLSIIRFAEIQIVEQPQECVNLIRDIFECVHNREKEHSFNALKKVKCWSKDEAHEMAFKQARLTYLPSKYHEKIKFETYSKEKFYEI